MPLPRRLQSAATLIILVTGVSLTGCAPLKRTNSKHRSFQSRMEETKYHLRSPKSSDWSNWKHHLHVVDPPAVAWATYRDTGRTEDGLATVVRDLFGNFLGPWSSDGLADYADHLGY